VCPFKAFAKLVFAIAVMLAAFAASMFTALTTLTNFALLAFPAFAVFLAFVDLNDIIPWSYSEGTSIQSRRWSASQSECRDSQCKTKACGCYRSHKIYSFLERLS
jgi:hypothetical protein